VLLDECIDWRLSREITLHEVRTVHQMGWSGLGNGELLALAAQEFDVFVTVDRNMALERLLVSMEIAVIVLRAKTNRLADLKPLIPDLLSTLPTAKPGRALIVGV
jgi:hypothetical protein